MMLLCLPLCVSAQKHKPKEGEVRTYHLKDMVFFSGGMVILSEQFTSPAKVTQSVNSGEAYEDIEFVSGLTLFGLVYELKFNLFDIRDYFSVSINSPLTIGGSVISGQKDGFGHMVLPAMLDFNFFNHSTFNNINKLGLHFGGGKQLGIAPLLGESSTNWLDTVIRLGIKFPYKGSNSYLNLTYGFGEKISYQGRTREKQFRNQYIKLSGGRLIGY